MQMKLCMSRKRQDTCFYNEIAESCKLKSEVELAGFSLPNESIRAE